MSNCSFAQTIPAYIPEAGLLAWYPFNGNANDGTTYGHNGVADGAVSYGTDRHGAVNSCYESGGNGLIDIPVHNFPVSGLNGRKYLNVVPMLYLTSIK